MLWFQSLLAMCFTTKGREDMRNLHNKISNKKLKEDAIKRNEHRTTVSFYKYFKIKDPQVFRDSLYKEFFALEVFGRIYVASEGINAQISVPKNKFEIFKEKLNNFVPELKNIRLNIAIEDNNTSFWVLRIKLREKIVADGIKDPAFDPSKTGTYLKASEVNQMMEDENTIFVDMRNHYEYEVGHFENAIEVPSDTFREQLPMAAEMLKNDKDKNIVMYCTGGIRCEKATAYMLHNGFENVFHVEGGIIEYARKAKEQNLPVKFIGKNFVFDDRMAERITEDVIAVCHQCGKPCDSHTNCANVGCNLLFIQCDKCKENYAGCCCETCKTEIAFPEEEQKILRKGKTANKIFNKARNNPLKFPAL